MRCALLALHALLASLADCVGRAAYGRAWPPIAAPAAIAFALDQIDDPFERETFLREWMFGNWTGLRVGWPEAFNLECGDLSGVPAQSAGARRDDRP